MERPRRKSVDERGEAGRVAGNGVRVKGSSGGVNGGCGWGRATKSRCPGAWLECTASVFWWCLRSRPTGPLSPAGGCPHGFVVAAGERVGVRGRRIDARTRAPSTHPSPPQSRLGRERRRQRGRGSLVVLSLRAARLAPSPPLGMSPWFRRRCGGEDRGEGAQDRRTHSNPLSPSLSPAISPWPRTTPTAGERGPCGPVARAWDHHPQSDAPRVSMPA